MTKMLYRIFSLFMALLAYIGVSAGNMGVDPYRTYFNVSYGESDSNVMDIYVPFSAAKREFKESL